MAIYSHSKISTFEQCKYKYKLQYIDKVKVEIPTTVEAFMGNIVHKVLEKLYLDLKYKKLNKKDELLSYYDTLWDKHWTDDILIVKNQYSKENYRGMGKDYIGMYYDRHYPFDQMTIIALETQKFLQMPDGNRYHVKIDKLGCVGNVYYVCDYKTNSQLKTQDEADKDRQLAMYSIWVKNTFKDASKVVLLWHMLAFDKDITSQRSDHELQELQKEVMNIIKKIETCNNWPTNVTSLCSYCVYRSMCPSFKHEFELEQKEVTEFKDDDGVKLVDAYVKAQAKKKQAEQELEELKHKLITFANQKDIDIVYGSNSKISVKPFPKVILPTDKQQKQEFITLLKNQGLYDELSSINTVKITSFVKKNSLPNEILNLLSLDRGYRLTVSKLDYDEN